MKKTHYIKAATCLLMLTGSSIVSASTLDNASLGIKMEIEDQEQLDVISQDLTHFIKDEYSWTSFVFNDEEIASLMVLSDQTDEDNQYETEYQAIVADGSHSYQKTSQNGYTYYLLYLNAEESSGQYPFIESILHAFEQAEYSVPVSPDLSTTDFQAVDLDGNTVTNEIFHEKDLTVINIWATWCNPCLNELPLLAEWEKELPEQVQILYLDYEGEGIANADKDAVEMIADKTGINRDHILLYENGFSPTIDSLTQAFPTTIFIDKEGNLLPDLIVGAYVERYKETVNNILEK